MSSITDLIMENTTIIIIVAVILVCIIIGYIGDKRFKAKGILEKKQNKPASEETIVETKETKEEQKVETMTTSSNEIPVFDTIEDISVTNNANIINDNVVQTMNEGFTNVGAQPMDQTSGVVYADSLNNSQPFSASSFAQQPVNNMPLTQMSDQANGGIQNPVNTVMQDPVNSNVQNSVNGNMQNPAQEFPFSPEDNINNIF